ncbi:MAG: hypothetical protein HOE62_20925 [Alphaproteobacteria bacterium]|jgi:hypothetical protein|nr:hypothetical protein [Alphaproteobacteria bacterium]MBT4020427.1 hypothetical protein [Alphaproteobacteria bacterium]MBT5159783.1 hypothetical protein [Alphaproteobacteria bacterium]MBT5920201.1 hypothetical protein [Alphaproteobacteria bacterium]MBT6386963.1 hypothetical protein [Alphaproteobacteria bacterium]
MSRLDSAIRRLEAQRDCLALAADMIKSVTGPVLELGLGNGRTYDHLRAILPDREIFVFDRQFAAHPDCLPDEAHAFLGDFSDTLPSALDRTGDLAALAHCDTGSGDKAATSAQAATLVDPVNKLVCSGGAIVSDQEFSCPDWIAVELPQGVVSGRYFIYRKR